MVDGQQQQQQPQDNLAPVNNQQAQNNVPVNQVQVLQGADGSINLKVEQTKLPEFWGQKEKDSIAANKFVKGTDKMMSANNWSNNIAIDNFALALRGLANTWLDSQVTLSKIRGDREC
jgi:hypothetical protein